MLFLYITKGTYAVPRGYGESGKASVDISAGTSGNIGSTGPKKMHYQSQSHASGHGGGGTSNDEILDDEEESMDWWTKYFASVDAMIEVRLLRFMYQKGAFINDVM